MVFALVRDVFTHLIEVARADGDCTVARLPLEELIGDELVGGKVRRRSLEALHEIGHRDGCWQTRQHMHMILYTTDGDQLRLYRGTFRADCSIQVVRELAIEQRQPIPCTPHKMEIHRQMRSLSVHAPPPPTSVREGGLRGDRSRP